MGHVSRLVPVRADRLGSARSEMALKGLRAELGGDTRMVRMMGELLMGPTV